MMSTSTVDTTYLGISLPSWAAFWNFLPVPSPSEKPNSCCKNGRLVYIEQLRWVVAGESGGRLTANRGGE